MASFKNLIARLSQRTAMYIGKNDIFYLDAFISGWLFCPIEDISDLHLFGDFQEWLRKKFNIQGTQGWAKIILFQCFDEKQALEYFFKLFNEFLEEIETE